MSTIELEINQLSAFIKNGEPLFAPFDLKFHGNMKLGVVGKNGSGKSTLLKILLGMNHIQISGEVKWSQPLHNFNYAYIPQQTKLNHFLKLTVMDLFKLICNHKQHQLEALEKFDLIGKEKTLFKDLSGGERQKVLIGMHWAHRPQLWFIDEPTIGLDSQSKLSFYKFLEELEVGFILVDHDIHSMLHACDHFICLHPQQCYFSKKDNLDRDFLEKLYHQEPHQCFHPEHGEKS